MTQFTMPPKWGEPGHIGNPHVVDVDHYRAEQVSYFQEPRSPEHYECAFFKYDKWQIRAVPEFIEYAEPVALDTRVYRYVPKALLDDWIETYRRG